MASIRRKFKLETFLKIIIIACFAAIVVIIAYYLISKGTSDQHISQNKQPSQKEMDSVKLKEIVLKYFDDLKNRNENISAYFTNIIKYYEKENATLDEVLNDKILFYKKYDSIKFNITPLRIKSNSDHTYDYIFEKEFNFNNTKDKVYYNGKFLSDIQFSKVNENWLICAEYDLQVYFTDKSKSFKEFAEEFLNKVITSKDFYFQNSMPKLTILFNDEPNNEKNDNTQYDWLRTLLSEPTARTSIKDKKIEITVYENSELYTGLFTYEIFFTKDIDGKWKLFKCNHGGC